MTLSVPLYLQNGSYSALDDRALVRAIVGAAGVVSGTDFATAQAGSPNMSVIVSAGRAFVQQTGQTDFYLVEQYPGSASNLTIAASDASNPRIDLVIARVYDSSLSGSDDVATLEVVTGTPASSPVAPTVPDHSLVLAQVAVAASASSITNGNITDARVLYTPARSAGGVLWIKKLSSESVTSSTTLQNDDHLALTLAANVSYKVEAFLSVSGITGGDFKTAWTTSGTAAFLTARNCMGPAVTVTDDSDTTMHARIHNQGTAVEYGTEASAAGAVREEFLVSGGASGGTVQLQWAQNTSNATATSLSSTSHMTATPLG